MPSLVLDASGLVDALRPDAQGSHTIDVECMSAWRALWLRGAIDDHALARALDALATWPVERLATTQLIPRIHELSPAVTPYDAAYVVIAEALSLRLLIRDARLARASGSRCHVELI